MKASLEIALLRTDLANLIGGAATGSAAKGFIYQPAGAESGLTVSYDIYRPNRTRDTTQSGIAEEVETSGRYVAVCVVNGPGWFALIEDSAGGKGCKYFD